MVGQRLKKKSISKVDVELRIEDWKKRVNEIYANIKTWLNESDYNVKEGRNVEMFEELMSRFAIQPTKIATLEIYKNKEFIMVLKPRGLWIIGANGRIDILKSNANYILVDYSEQFTTPQWKLFDGNSNNNGIEFNQKEFLNLLIEA